MLGRVMKIAEKSLRFISMSQPDALNCIERIIEKIRIIRSDTEIKPFLFNFILNGYEKLYNGINSITFI